ncbi:MAG: hypothetical protein NC340_06475 [Ruminococcus flavefaciens]|nr:hypothetical protein [Ruminococcus flavefaciens]MCM1229727.1 hypothetical protein [Ruminococcus flavefaciens]
MQLIEKFKEKKTAVITVLGAVGLLLIMISSVLPDKKQSAVPSAESSSDVSASESYRIETESRLRDFLEKIDGAGEVEVYLTVGSGERYIYASEEKKIQSESKTEEENKYVIFGSEKEPLVETVETPEITGAVIVCTGGGSPVVEERIYKAVSSALGISTSKIYVTKIK